MQVSSSVKAALAIALVVLLYFGARNLFRGGETAEETAAEASLFTVVAQTVEPGDWRDEVRVRGRTEALRRVAVRAETAGVVAETPARLGALVEEGDVLCRLKVDARRAALTEARASVQKAELDYNAAAKLAGEGFRAETAVASAKAALDLARANLEQARLNLAKTNITAPFAGVFDNRAVEVGDFVAIGDPCGVVIQQDPFLATGGVSDRAVTRIAVGDRGVARLSTGEVVEGTVRFVATSADAVTRTFRVELEIPNEKGALKEGVTTQFTIYADRRNAHLVPRSAIGLDDEQRTIVRTLNPDSTVHLTPVRVLGESENGFWIDGLEGAVAIITRGQDYVREGQKVAIAESTAGVTP
ncbi:MAG: efflux RND transporter periplasmic adaptor subunit [Pseudomonadota bacterium]